LKSVVPPLIAAVEDCTVIALVAELPKLLLTGVKVVGEVSVPPFTIVKLPDIADNKDDPPMLPLKRDI